MCRCPPASRDYDGNLESDCCHLNGSQPHHGLGPRYPHEGGPLLMLKSPGARYEVTWGQYDKAQLALYQVDGTYPGHTFVGRLHLKPENAVMKDWTQARWRIEVHDYSATDYTTLTWHGLDDALCLLVAIHEARRIPAIVDVLLNGDGRDDGW